MTFRALPPPLPPSRVERLEALEVRLNMALAGIPDYTPRPPHTMPSSCEVQPGPSLISISGLPTDLTLDQVGCMPAWGLPSK